MATDLATDRLELETSVRRRELEIIEAVDNLLPAPNIPAWETVKPSFAAEHVEEFQATVKRAWRADITLEQLYTPPSKKVRVLYIADKPSKSIMWRDIARMSLYADEIILLDPFSSPYDFGTLGDPANHRFETFQNLRFLKKLNSWIRAGIVRLAPDPFFADPSKRNELSLLVEDERSRAISNTTSCSGSLARDIPNWARAIGNRLFP